MPFFSDNTYTQILSIAFLGTALYYKALYDILMLYPSMYIIRSTKLYTAYGHKRMKINKNNTNRYGTYKIILGTIFLETM